MHSLQALAVPEDTVIAQQPHGIRQDRLFQAVAELEGIGTDSGNRVRDLHRLHPLAFHKGIITDTGNTRSDDHPADQSSIYFPGAVHIELVAFFIIGIAEVPHISGAGDSQQEIAVQGPGKVIAAPAAGNGIVYRDPLRISAVVLKNRLRPGGIVAGIQHDMADLIPTPFVGKGIAAKAGGIPQETDAAVIVQRILREGIIGQGFYGAGNRYLMESLSVHGVGGNGGNGIGNGIFLPRITNDAVEDRAVLAQDGALSVGAKGLVVLIDPQILQLVAIGKGSCSDLGNAGRQDQAFQIVAIVEGFLTDLHQGLGQGHLLQ